MSDDNPAKPLAGATLCAVDAIKLGGAIVLDFAHEQARYSILVARNKDGEIAAYENLCPHARSPLERPDGRVVVHEQKFLVCANHGASFRMEDGRCVAGPGLGTALNRVGIVVAGGFVVVASA